MQQICTKEEERELKRNLLQANGFPNYIINRNYSLVSKLLTTKIEPKASLVIPYLRYVVSEGFYARLMLKTK